MKSYKLDFCWNLHFVTLSLVAAGGMLLKGNSGAAEVIQEMITVALQLSGSARDGKKRTDQLLI